jgi:hypothetical protein
MNVAKPVQGGAWRVAGAPVRWVGALWRAAIGLIGPGGSADARAIPERAVDLRWLVGMALSAGLGLVLVALSHYLGLRQVPRSGALLWVGFALLYLPVALRVAAPRTARAERIAGLILIGVCAFLAKFLYAPTGFSHFDELLHVATARDILETRRLYELNPLLPISPLYPGLEIVTTSLVELTGLSLDFCANFALVVARCVLMGALFAFYERVGGSDRIGALATLAYVTNSGFFLFDAQFAYESLALVFFVLALQSASLAERGSGGTGLVAVALTIVFLVALAVTHHMSAYFAAAFLLLLAVLKLFTKGRAPARIGFVFAGVASLALPYLWSKANGDPGGGYLGPILENGSTEIMRFIRDGARREGVFTLPNGLEVPFALQIVSIVSLALVSFLLMAGFFRTLALAVRPEAGWRALGECLRFRWTNPWLVLLALVACGFPVSVGFRLTSTAWEIGNRMGPFVYLGVGMVAAFAVARFWKAEGQPVRAALVALALTVAFVGGINTGWGLITQRQPFMAVADSASVEPMSIETAEWSREWLGPGNRFAADRVNRNLLAAYGRQRVITTLFDDVDASQIFLSPTISSGERSAIRRGRIDYLLVDLRLSAQLPMMGHYYEMFEERAQPWLPVDPEALLKFNEERGLDRVYDNGWIIVFGTEGIRGGR